MDINKLNRHFIAVDNLDNIDAVIDVLTEPWIIKYEDTYYSTESNNNMKITLLDKGPEYIKDYYNKNRATILALCTSEDNKYYTFVYKNLLTDLNDYIDSEGNSFFKYVKDIIIPNSVTSISFDMFSGKTNLESITLSNSLTSIHSFDGCTNLTYIDIPNSVITIEEDAFAACVNLKTVKFGNSLNEINNNAFSSCTSLTSIIIPPSVNYIKDNVFFNCTNMSSVILNNGVKTIGENAFEGCVNLTSIKLPESLTSITANTFTNCKQLTIISTEYGDFKTDLYGDISIVYNNGNSMVFNVREAINNEIWYTTTNDEKLFLQQASSLKINHEYKLGKGVITFFEQTQLTEIIAGLFRGKENLSTIQLPLTVDEINEYAFAGCTSLNSIKLTNINTIGDYAFSECLSLTSVTFSEINANHNINNNIFEGCKNLDHIIVDDEIFYKKNNKITVYDSNKNPFTFYLEEMIHDDEIWYTTIDGEKAEFGSPYPNPDISTFADGGEYYFQSGIPGEEGLEEWYTPHYKETYTVLSHEYNQKVGYFIIKFDKPIKEYVLQTYDPSASDGGGWQSTNKPNKVILPTELEYIHHDAFGYCTDMDSITIPNTVTYIGSRIFSRSNVTTIEYPGTKEQWNAITKEKYSFIDSNTITVKCLNGDIIIENNQE